MITIKKNGKFIIPENEVFIGHAGDNLNVTKEFFVDGVTDVSLVYRMYLQFDDGTTNFFLLDSETTENGTKLVWNVTNDQIYKSGILKMQIKASNSSGVVFHSAITSLVAHTSIEFGEAYKNKENSEFLQHEQYLNDLIDKEREYLEELKEYEAGLTDRTRMDSEPVENSPRAVQSGGIYNALKAKLDNADGSVKENNIENGAVTGAKLSSTLYAKIFSDSLGYTSLGGEANPEANPFDTNITPSRLCTCVYNDTRYIFISTWWLFNNEQPAPAQYRFSDNGIELRRYSYADKQWSDWEFVGKEAEIADGSVTAEKLSAELRDTIDTLNAADYMQYFNAGELTDKTDLNVPNFADVTAIWQLTIGGDLAAAIKGEESTFTAELRYIAPYQILTDVETRRVYIRRVTRIAPNFSAEAWEERTPDFIVNSDKIADNGITTAKLADRSVTWAKIADGAISSAKMGDGAVTTSRIANGAVTEEKLSDELKAVIYANNSVPEIAPYGSATISFESATISFTGTDRPDNFSGKYESSKNKYIIYGKIAVSETYNSDKINLPENYAPICDSCAIGVGSARNGKKHYIVNVNSTESNIEFEVFNMDGTVPTEDDEVTFTVTALKR